MYATYLRLVQLFEDNNLGNHVSSIKYELINDGTGFRVWCNDWVVFFNEYGTGLFNSNGGGKQEPWVYFKDGEFFTTNFFDKEGQYHGLMPKFMFTNLKKELNEVARDYYNTAISYAINQKSYEEFKSIADGSIRL